MEEYVTFGREYLRVDFKFTNNISPLLTPI